MKDIKVWVVRDNFYKATMCVVDGAPSEDDAIEFAKRTFPEGSSGDLRAVLTPFAEYEERENDQNSTV